MTKKNFISIVFIIATLLISTGCGPSPDQATATAAAIVAATQTAQPTPTPEPTDTPTPEPTETPTPEPTDTPTPEPTDTPEPTETPTPEPTEISLEDYEHPSGAFSLSVPGDWEMTLEDAGSVNFAESELTFLTANFGAEEADVSEDPRAYIDLFMEGFTDESGLTEDDYEIVTDETEADGSSYTALAIDTPDGGEMRVNFFIQPEEESVFVLAFITTDFERFETTWEAIRDSFTVDVEAALAAIEASEPVASAETEPAETESEPAGTESEPAETPAEGEASAAELAALEGFTFMGQEEWDQAIAAFEEAIQLDPQLGLAYEGLGYSYISGPGDLEKARDAFQTYLDLTPDAEDRAQIEETIAQIDEILAGGGSSGDPLVDQLRQIDIPEGKALFYFANYSGETWNVDVGPNFMQAPPPGPDQTMELSTIFIDPGTYTWQAHSADAGYYIVDENNNRAFEFTVGAGEVYGTQCCN